MAGQTPPGAQTPRASQDDVASQATQADPASQTAPTAHKDYTICTACGESGCYVTDYLFPGACSLFYLDFETGQQMFLCSDPACHHDTEDCTSYFSTEESAPPQPLVAGEHLLYLYTNNRPGAPIRIEISRLDGSERRVLCAIQDDQVFMGDLLTDGEALYAQVGTSKPVGDDIEFTERLVKISLADGEMQVLHTFPVNDPSHLPQGVGDGKIALFTLGCWDEAHKDFDDSISFLHWYDPDAQPAVESEPFLVYENMVNGAFVQDGKLYTTDYQTHVIRIKQLATGEVASWDYSKLLPDVPILFPGLVPLFPGCLSLSLRTEDGGGQMYLLNEATPGSFTPLPTLTRDYDGKDIILQGHYQDKLCVIRDFYEEPVLQTIYGEEQLTNVIRTVYAMISVEDYLAGRPQYEDMPLINGA